MAYKSDFFPETEHRIKADAIVIVSLIDIFSSVLGGYYSVSKHGILSLAMLVCHGAALWSLKY